MRARQVAPRYRPAPSAVWIFRRIWRDCASFSGCLAMAGFLQASCSISPIVFRCISIIALCEYYAITLYHCYPICRDRI